jgi:hypothetical protein
MISRYAALTLGVALMAGALTAYAGVPLEQVDRIYDFGEVGIGFDIYHEFKVLNQGNEPIRIDSATVRCDCSTAWLIDSVVAPGDTGRIGLRFNTEDYYGKTSKALKVHIDVIPDRPAEYFYLTTVGQWFVGIKPDPISLFFLPGSSEKTITISNPAVDWIKIAEIDPYNDFVSTDIIEEKASKGKNLELVVRPKADLGEGTFYTNFRIKLELPEEFEPIYLTIPVKIVRY